MVKFQMLIYSFITVTREKTSSKSKATFKVVFWLVENVFECFCKEKKTLSKLSCFYSQMIKIKWSGWPMMISFICAVIFI